MTRACILGCAGTNLTSDERVLFERAQPFGFILFARNVERPEQVRALVGEMRALVGRDDAPVLIDQEGGRVQRLRPPHWPDFPPAARFGEIHARDAARGLEAVRLGARLIAQELSTLGINVDCLPVADLLFAEGHGIIGDRAYGGDPVTVAKLARAAAEGLIEGGVLPVVKHIPGHGRARSDSHEELPVVETPLDELDRTDFESFRRLKDIPIGMTAHVVYTAIDPERAATVSPIAIEEVIRGRIGFDGLLLSDDLSMKALKGSLGSRTEAALAAGCDVALHCNGRLAEMQEVVAASRSLDGEAARRAGAALGRQGTPGGTPGKALNVAEARARFSAMMTA
ncbi:MAG TPA: beta-N-acetylhexosaminidase [Xanthobacteraceae bacterium]|nr:beta-N-acetylhexosaminidase [Xanthobacteraceae bacterium]